eukprot:jgi/Chlat1/5843/Chrsp4S06229
MTAAGAAGGLSGVGRLHSLAPTALSLETQRPPPLVFSSKDLQSLARKLGVGSRTWLRIDANGNRKVLEADKYVIMARVGLPARDLRTVDPHLSYPSTILVRERALVVNMEHVRCIITPDEVLVLNHADPVVVPVVEELQRRLPEQKYPPRLLSVASANGFEFLESERKDTGLLKHLLEDKGPPAELPFEFRALEVVLEAVCGSLDTQACARSTNQVTTHNLDRVRKLKTKMTRLYTRVETVREELEALLDDDSDMADMYLTRKLQAPAQPRSPSHRSMRSGWVGAHEDIQDLEALLEVYFSQIEGAFNILKAVKEYIDDTEDYINIYLDSHRNKIIKLQVLMATLTCAFTMPYIAYGMFSMNISTQRAKPLSFYTKKDGEVVNPAFWPILFTPLAFAVLFSFAVLLYCRYKKLMWY